MQHCCSYSACSKSATKKCTACKARWYCSRDHQRADWRSHKLQCKLATPTTLNTVVENTKHDAQIFQNKLKQLVSRLEEAITLRNRQQISRAEELFISLLTEAEDLCGRNCVHIATFVKSLGILRTQQYLWADAEQCFARADKLRPADCKLNTQGTHTLEHLFQVQVHRRHFAKAVVTLCRIKKFKHCSREGTDTSISNLEAQMQTAKTNALRCTACGTTPTKLLACGRCHVPVYCSRKCQKTHWKAHKADCKLELVIGGKEQEHKGQAQIPYKDTALTEAVQANAEASQQVSPSAPTEFNRTLLMALADPEQCYFFAMNDVTSSSLLDSDGGRRRFIATCGVLTCITVFAWSPPTPNEPLGRCVAGHVSLNALLRGLR
jgi:hypothetical protein